MHPVWYISAFVIALVITLATVPSTIWLSKRCDAIDYPDGRRVNDRPIGRLGGIAIFVGIMGSLGILALLIGPILPDVSLRVTVSINYPGVAASLAVIFAVGLIDDFRTIRARYKLLGQILAAIIACYSGVLLDAIANPFDSTIIDLGFWAYPITIFYLVAFANIINLIDGLDGLAAGIVCISAVALLIISFGKGFNDIALATLAISGACLAFLKYNSYPARIFMGDSGALFLGFLVGVISLFGVARTPVIITLLVPVVIAGIPVIDTFAAIIRRLRSRAPIAEADMAHIHHRLLNIGYDQKTTVYILYILTGLLSFCAILIIGRGDWVRIVALVVLIILVAALIFSLKLTEPILKHHFAKQPRGNNWKGPSFRFPATKKYVDENAADTAVDGAASGEDASAMVSVDDAGADDANVSVSEDDAAIEADTETSARDMQ